MLDGLVNISVSDKRQPRTSPTRQRVPSGGPILRVAFISADAVVDTTSICSRCEARLLVGVTLASEVQAKGVETRVS